ncbi:hypothetical protein [Cellulophaga algicola]|nr:hypothetical protein [Cellulophaga algicola]
MEIFRKSKATTKSRVTKIDVIPIHKSKLNTSLLEITYFALPLAIMGFFL